MADAGDKPRKNVPKDIAQIGAQLIKGYALSHVIRIVLKIPKEHSIGFLPIRYSMPG